MGQGLGRLCLLLRSPTRQEMGHGRPRFGRLRSSEEVFQISQANPTAHPVEEGSLPQNDASGGCVAGAVALGTTQFSQEELSPLERIRVAVPVKSFESHHQRRGRPLWKIGNGGTGDGQDQATEDRRPRE